MTLTVPFFVIMTLKAITSYLQTLCTRPISFPLYQDNRPRISMPPLDQIKHHRKRNDGHVDQDIPIESRRMNLPRFGEKTQHKDQYQIEDSDRIDRAGISTHTPARRG